MPHPLNGLVPEVLEYLQQNDVYVMPGAPGGWEGPFFERMAEDIGATPVQLRAVLAMLLRRRRLVFSRTHIMGDMPHEGAESVASTMAFGQLVVNPNPPVRPAKRLNVRRLRTSDPAGGFVESIPDEPEEEYEGEPDAAYYALLFDEAATTITALRELAAKLAAQVSEFEARARQKINVETDLSRYVNDALTLLRRRAAPGPIWQSLENLTQTGCESWLASEMNITSGGAKKLVEIMMSQEQLRFCEPSHGGCGHVKVAEVVILRREVAQLQEQLSQVGSTQQANADKLTAEHQAEVDDLRRQLRESDEWLVHERGDNAELKQALHSSEEAVRRLSDQVVLLGQQLQQAQQGITLPPGVLADVEHILGDPQ